MDETSTAIDDRAMQGRTTCPFVRSALKAGLLGFDGATAPRARLLELLGGGPNGLGRVAAFFARRNHTTPGMPPGRYDPLNLAGSRGDHPGDSGILTTFGFDTARFDAFTAHARTAPDGRRCLTAEDLGAAIAEDLARDPSSRVGWRDVLFANDMRNSAGEFGLLLEAFGRALPDGTDRGEKAVAVDDMRELFEHGRFPEGWRETVARSSAFGWATTSFGLSGFGGIYGAARRAYRRR